MAALITKVFHSYVAPAYTREGVNEFLKYADPASLAKRSRSGHFVLLAEDEQKVVGMIEVREHRHVSMLFVEGSYQRKGVARLLVSEALVICQRRRADLVRVTVNAAPNSVEAYERLGFHVEGSEHRTHGIRFTPMVLEIGAGEPR